MLKAAVAVVVGLGALAGPGAPPSSAAAPDAPPARQGQRISLTLTSAGEAVTGDAVTFAGSATKKLRGRKVRLLRSVGGGAWVEVGKARIQRDRTFTIQGVASGVGANAWQVRAKTKPVKRNGRTVKKGRAVTSGIVQTTVLQWFFLSDRAWVDSKDEAGSYPFRGSMTSGGTAFTRSISFGSYTSAWDWERASWAEYNLGYHCRRFEASIGISDTSATGTDATFFVSLDGARRSVGRKVLGAPSPVGVDVAGVLSLRLEGVPNSQDRYGRGGFGDARVLCAAQP
ncbi:NPCBM/NEW2 domain-containing protein [Nocardioides sp. L-11A]|uniref:NPCBM/NEW2 domain-containing protein n=1 Tax=Nocardioides sp. L-11A TaxID=3043848 RepID=UPI00249B2375|nr:NPCBM/NEW2 domain-containing protein [Nocardioides sp. L-11A]